LIHWFGIQAAKQRFGWIYLLLLGIFWMLVIIALSGGKSGPLKHLLR
jgi:hypothetical protein